MMSSSGSTENENLSLGRRIIRDIQTKKSVFWEKERKTRALRLFHDAAREVPAYKDFLHKNRIHPQNIKTFEDFQNVPPVSKKNYLLQYPLEKLVWGGTLKKPLVWTSTSGSTGAPFYFPRGAQLDWQSSLIHELFLDQSSYGRTSTLAIVGFGMGAWIGGLITYQALMSASRRTNYPLSIITPGINKVEILKALRLIAPNFDQVILIGYPPFLKDVIDEAIDSGIPLKKMRIRLLFAAEAFTEKFREHISSKVGIKDVYRDTMNIYGTADIGTMACETPAALLLRRLIFSHRDFAWTMFPTEGKTPTLAQYNPMFIIFEAPEGNILLTGDNTIPLIRYTIGDHGGVFSFAHMKQTLAARGFDLGREARKLGLGILSELPFVYVYERADFSTKLYGANIHGEPIREALIHPPFAKFFTGKFTMLTQFDKHLDQFLEINIELRPKMRPIRSLKNDLRSLIIKNLLQKNSEFRNNYSLIPEKVTPRLVFWTYEHPLHFRQGGKHKWKK